MALCLRSSIFKAQTPRVTADLILRTGLEKNPRNKSCKTSYKILTWSRKILQDPRLSKITYKILQADLENLR